MTQAFAGGSSQRAPAPNPVHRYVPMLKTKAGEITALQNLSGTARSRIMPLFHVCEEVKPSFVPGLAAAWAGMLTAVDGSFNHTHNGSPNATTALVTAMRNSGIPTMPCWSLVDPLPYQHAARALVDGNGGAVKVSLANIPIVAGWLSQQNLLPSMIDLVIDLKHLASINVVEYAGYVSHVLNQNASSLLTYRSVTLAAAAAPKDHGSLTLGVNRIPRLDWSLWNAVNPSLNFSLDYGDYLTGHPDLKEPPGAAMANATVSARYTLDNVWLIVKGRQTGGQYGLPMRQQYHSHAHVIANDPGFSGVANVWADAQIGQAAVGASGMGSRAKWSGFAANRHMSLVVDRLP